MVYQTGQRNERALPPNGLGFPKWGFFQTVMWIRIKLDGSGPGSDLLIGNFKKIHFFLR